MPKIGGAARRAAVIKAEKAKGGNVLVLDGGDSLTGDQDPAMKTAGASSVEMMDRLGYDAMVLGPADLALGANVLAERSGEAHFAFLSANAAEGGQQPGKPYIIREFGGQRVAVVGLSGAAASGRFTLQDPVATAQAIVQELQGQADAIIILSHSGPEIDHKIADTVAGVTAIVAGGAEAVGEPYVSAQTSVPVYHADQPSSGHAGRAVGIATLDLDANGKLVSQKWRRLMLGPEVVDDPQVAAWVAEQTKP
jgi:5'-nucleotidase / UDP-sugar diphosphatase